MSMKNKTAQPAKAVSKKASEKRIDIGENTLNVLAQHFSQIEAYKNAIKEQEISVNRIVCAFIESSGVKIHEGIKINIDNETKQFVIS